MTRFWIYLSLLAFLLNGCGYRFGGEAIDLPGGASKVHVALFENRTLEPYLDTVVTGSLIERLVRLHNVRVTEQAEEAEVVLDGNVLQYELTALAYDANDTIQSYRVTMKVDATLARTSDGKILWSGEAIRYEDFDSSGIDIIAQEGIEFAVLKQVAARIAEDLSWQMATGFGGER